MSGYMVSSTVNIHWVERVSAETNTPGVLKLTFHGNDSVTDEQFNTAEVLVFTENPALIDRLVAAINGAADSDKGAA